MGAAEVLNRNSESPTASKIVDSLHKDLVGFADLRTGRSAAARKARPRTSSRVGENADVERQNTRCRSARSKRKSTNSRRSERPEPKVRTRGAWTTRDRSRVRILGGNRASSKDKVNVKPIESTLSDSANLTALTKKVEKCQEELDQFRTSPKSSEMQKKNPNNYFYELDRLKESVRHAELALKLAVLNAEVTVTKQVLTPNPTETTGANSNGRASVSKLDLPSRVDPSARPCDRTLRGSGPS